MHIMLNTPVLNIGHNREYLEHQKRYTGYYGDLLKGIVGDKIFNQFATAKGTTNALLKNEILSVPIYIEPCDDSKVLIEFASLLQLRLSAYDQVVYSHSIVEVLPVKNLDAYIDKICDVYCTKEKVDTALSEYSDVFESLTSDGATLAFKDLIITILIKTNLNFDTQHLPKELWDRIDQRIKYKIKAYFNLT